MEAILQTARLRIRQFTLDDAFFTMNLTNTKDWLNNIGDRNTASLELARQYLANGNIQSYIDRGYGGYLVELKANLEPIGMCGLFKRECLDHPDIGFAFLPEYYREGYGFEAASAVLRYALEDLNLEKVLGITLASNKASIALLGKIGLTFSGTITLPGDSDELMLFSS